MNGKKHTTQEISTKPRDPEIELNQGATIEGVARKLETNRQALRSE